MPRTVHCSPGAAMAAPSGDSVVMALSVKVRRILPSLPCSKKHGVRCTGSKLLGVPVVHGDQSVSELVDRGIT
eukprot:3477573-Rhodomonas_salina.2